MRLFVRMADARESDRAVSVSNALSRRECRFRDRKGHGDEPDASRAVGEQGPTPRCCSVRKGWLRNGTEIPQGPDNKGPRFLGEEKASRCEGLGAGAAPGGRGGRDRRLVQ